MDSHEPRSRHNITKSTPRRVLTFLFTKPSPSPLLAPAARHWHLLPLSCLPPPEFINPESTVALLRSSKPRQALPRRLQILVLPVPGRPSTVQWGTRSPPPPLRPCAPPSPPRSSSPCDCAPPPMCALPSDPELAAVARRRGWSLCEKPNYLERARARFAACWR